MAVAAAKAKRKSAPRRAARAASAPLAAYVLHRYDWSESSLILDLWTREEGRVAVVAKGAKRPYSQWRSVLLPFQRIVVVLGSVAPDADPAASDIRALRSADWAGGAAMLTGSALFSGFYLNELLLRLVARHDAHPALFDAYAGTLTSVAAGTRGDETAVEAALRAFELVLLRESGLLPDLSLVTTTQQPVDPAARYVLSPENGVLAAGAGVAGLDGATLTALEAALRHRNLAALQHACRAERVGLKRPLRGLIQHQLGDTPLRTRRVMAGLRGLGQLPVDRESPR